MICDRILSGKWSPASRFKFIYRWVIVSLLQIMILSVTAIEGHSDQIHKILILHSYHQGLTWTDNVNKGIRSVFDTLGSQYELYFDYLDVKRRSSRISNYSLKKNFYNKFKQIAFDAVIVSDNEAFNWLVSSEIPNQLKLPVVFCGVTHEAWERVSVAFPIAGVIQAIDHAANFDLMFKLHPRCKRIIFIFDWASNSTARRALNDIMTAKPGHVTVDTWPDPPLDGLPVRLQSLDANDLVYLLIVNRDKRLTYLYSDEGINTLADWSPAPIYSPLEAYFGKGIVGGRITSGFSQGESAAEMVLNIMAGEPLPNTPVIKTGFNLDIFDYRQLKRFKIPLSRLPSQSIVRFTPPPLLQRRPAALIAVIAGALMVILALSMGMALLLRRQQTLVAGKSELDSRLKEKSVQLKLMNQKLKKQVTNDTLTGLANRRHILQRFGEEVKRAQRYGTSLTIALFDLDGFKQINVEIGYVLGDQILRDVARTIRRNIREIDLAGRFSGEAFLIVMPNTDILMARSSAERILTAVASLQWEDGQIQVTLSGGLAQYTGQSLPELTTQAENLQQEAKNQGGNQILPLL